MKTCDEAIIYYRARQSVISSAVETVVRTEILSFRTVNFNVHAHTIFLRLYDNKSRALF